MKNRTKQMMGICGLVIGLGAGVMPAKELPLEACPESVKKAVMDHRKGGEVDEIDLIALDDREIYIVEIDGPGQREVKVYLDGDGKLIKTREEIRLEDAPMAVREAVKKIGGEVDDVERETMGEKVTYEVELERKGQPDVDIVFSENGEVLSRTEERDD